MLESPEYTADAKGYGGGKLFMECFISWTRKSVKLKKTFMWIDYVVVIVYLLS
jgi:hypothetical protein